MADRHSLTPSSDDVKGHDVVEVKDNASVDQVDFVAYYENNAGRLVVDPEWVFFHVSSKSTTYHGL